MLVLPPGVVATITRAMDGGQAYYTAGVGSAIYRILINWEKDGNQQTGYTTTSGTATVLGHPQVLRARKATRKLSYPSQAPRARSTSTSRRFNETEATMRDEYFVGNMPEVIVHHLPHKEL